MTPEVLPYQVTSRRVNEIVLEVAEAGPPDGPLVVLLHGFPDAWQGWHFQIPALTEAGYRVLAPNQRGYGASTRPLRVSDYDLDCLAQDVVGLAASEGRERFSLIGHDWGGIVGWWTAARHPGHVERLAILNAPHPGIFKTYLLGHPGQVLRSWYVGFFQLPWLPETLLSLNDYALLFRAVRATSRPGVFDATDRQYLRRAWSQPGALTSMLNYYRALPWRPEEVLRVRVTIPTLMLFGCRDPSEQPGLARASLGLCDNGRIVWLENAWHWVQREEPDLVNRELLGFLGMVGRPGDHT